MKPLPLYHPVAVRRSRVRFALKWGFAVTCGVIILGHAIPAFFGMLPVAAKALGLE